MFFRMDFLTLQIRKRYINLNYAEVWGYDLLVPPPFSYITYLIL
jgi:hypothetical protein